MGQSVEELRAEEDRQVENGRRLAREMFRAWRLSDLRREEFLRVLRLAYDEDC